MTEMTISPFALAIQRLRRRYADPSPLAMDVARVYAPYKYPDGIVATEPPAGLAMDWAPGGDAGLPGTINQWALGSLFHEGQGFFGFPYLAELFQRAEYRHACEIWAEHVVRKWIVFKGGDDKKRDELTKFIDEKLKARERFYEWSLLNHRAGRAQMFLSFGDADDRDELATPLLIDKAKVNTKRPLLELVVVDPMWAAPGTYETANPLKSNFYKPSRWFVYGRIVDSSRLLTLTSRPVPDMLKPAYAFGGMSLIQIMKPYVDNWLRTRQAVSDLLNMHSQPVLSTDLSSLLGGGDGANVLDRLQYWQDTRNNYSAMALDKGTEEFEFVTTPLSGLDALQAQAQEQMASVARIPLSIFLQVTPTGLNATTDGETRNFYADCHAYQEAHFRPALQRLKVLAELSLWGEPDDEITFEFPPLWEMSDKDKSDIRKSDAEADTGYVNAGIVSAEEARDRLGQDETGLYHGIDLSAPPPEPPEPDVPDEFGDKPAKLESGDEN